jgi:Fe-S cluster biogenesis protein NfuA
MSTGTGTDADLPDDVRHATARASRRFRSHAGGVDLVGVADGTATVRFTGTCTGCACRPQCLTATVEPALLAVDGVDGVEAVGVRVDAAARERFRAFLATDREVVR